MSAQTLHTLAFVALETIFVQKNEKHKTLANNKEIILKKADKGSTTVLMSKAGKIRGLHLLNNPLHCAKLGEPIVESDEAMNIIVSRWHANRHIDDTTSRYLRHV